MITLTQGSDLFVEGDQGEWAYVISSGEIEILKRSGEREVLLAVRKEGEVIGEMALLQGEPRSASARARTAAELICIPKVEIDALMQSSTGAVRALFKVLLDRWRSTQTLLVQSERMAQLGTLTAGLAHELNNPAAAVNRAVSQLRDSVASAIVAERNLASAVNDDSAARIGALRLRLEGSEPTPRLDPIARSDAETMVEDRLHAAGVAAPWRLASAIVERGLGDDLGWIIEDSGLHVGEVLEVLRAEHDVSSLLYEVEEGTRRLSAIVTALKSYTYLDRAPVQDVDIITGIEDTLLMLKSKFADIEVRREYDPDLPRIQALGSELNQVWTNLLDNAAYAIHQSDRQDGLVTIRATPRVDGVAVEIEDNGVGISAESLHRVFDSFFTTKPPGSGTGLGLNISYAIIVNEHRGDLSVTSEPGKTVFRVELPGGGPE